MESVAASGSHCKYNELLQRTTGGDEPMRRWMATVLSGVCVSLIVVAGCRDDQINATPLVMPDPDVADTTGEPTFEEAVGGEPVVEAAGERATDEGAEADAPPVAADRAPAPVPAPDADASQAPARRPQATAPDAPTPAQSAPSEDAPAAAERPGRQRPAASPQGGFDGAGPGMQGQRPTGQARGDLFEQRDANSDGLLQRDEIPEAFRERMMAADADGDGALSREEIREALSRRQGAPGGQLSPEERRARLMERLDANNDGKLQVEELPERMRERLSQADADGDGVLSEAEMAEARGAWQRRGGGGPRGGPNAN